MGYIGNSPAQNEAVDTAQLADNSITLAKMASGTDGALITYDTSGNPVAITGTDGQVATSAGTGAVSAFEGRVVEMFYPAITATHADAGYYSVALPMDDSDTARAGGRAPVGFTSVSDCNIILLRGETGGNDSGIQVGWATNAHHQARTGEDRAHFTVASLANSNIPTADDVYIGTFFNENNDGADFEDKVAAGDAFSFEVRNTGADVVTVFGVSVTWVF